MKKIYAMMAASLFCGVAAAQTNFTFSPTLDHIQAWDGKTSYPYLEAAYFEAGYVNSGIVEGQRVIGTTESESGGENSSDIQKYLDGYAAGTFDGNLQEDMATRLNDLDLGSTGDYVVNEKGLCYFKVPTNVFVGGQPATATKGDVRLRLVFGSNSGVETRPGYRTSNVDLRPCTGVQLGVYAPAGSTVKVCFTSSAANFKDDFGKMFHTIVYDMGTKPNSGLEDMKIDADWHNLIGSEVLQYDGGKYLDGENTFHFPIKYVDVIIGNVKPGDWVGYTNFQSLEAGYTPVATPADADTLAGVAAIEADENAPVEYFNLQGVRVENPTAAGLYIKRQGAKAAKVLVK